MPLYIIGAALTVFVVVIMMVAMDRAAQQAVKAETEDVAKATPARAMAAEILSKSEIGIVPLEVPAEPVVPLPETEPKPVNPGGASPQASVPVMDLKTPPPPQRQSKPLGDDDEGMKNQRRVREQSLDRAMRARTAVQVPELKNRGTVGGSTGAANTVGPRDAMAAYQQRVTQLKAMGIGSGVPMEAPR
ncbi:hypothetical protein FBY14_12414 [Azospirillum brasilense]|nr:hypothetical protein FBY14_12414 [Azospirillum brasilense]